MEMAYKIALLVERKKEASIKYQIKRLIELHQYYKIDLYQWRDMP